MPLQTKVKVKVPATSGNLGPGFDVLGIALSLYNELELACAPNEKPNKKGDVKFVIIGEGSDRLFSDHRNLIWQAAEKVFKRTRFPVEKYNFRFVAKNRIPLTRGLGSSSAAIMSGILAANKISGNRLSEEEILNLATEMEGHPDNLVPALVGGFTIAEETNGRVQYLRLDAPKHLQAVVCVPEYDLSTAKARAVLPKKVCFEDALFNVKKVSRLVGALCSKNFDFLKDSMEDKLHQPYRGHLVPGFRNVLQRGYHAGALGMALSGAGPSVFAFAQAGKAAKVSEAMRIGFLDAGKKSRSFVFKFDNKGSQII